MMTSGRNSLYNSPCQFVPATPSLYRGICRSPGAEVPASPLSVNYSGTPSSLSSQGLRGTPTRAMEMEFGEQILFLQEVPVPPMSAGECLSDLSGTQGAHFEQTVPTTPLTNPRRRRVTPLLTSSHSSPSPKTCDIRQVPDHDVRKGRKQSRAEKQKRRSHWLLSSCGLPASDLALGQSGDDYVSLRADGSDENIFL